MHLALLLGMAPPPAMWPKGIWGLLLPHSSHSFAQGFAILVIVTPRKGYLSHVLPFFLLLCFWEVGGWGLSAMSGKQIHFLLLCACQVKVKSFVSFSFVHTVGTVTLILSFSLGFATLLGSRPGLGLFTLTEGFSALQV